MVTTGAIRTMAVAVMSAAIVYSIWLGPQVFLGYMGYKLRNVIDYRFALTLIQAILLFLLALVLRAPLHRLSTGAATVDGLRPVVWFTVAGVMFSLLGAFTIAMTNPGTPSELPFSMTLQRWTSEFQVTGIPGRLVAYVIVVPAFEELLFRGLILGFLLRRSAPWLALAISTLLFAAIHSNWLHATFAGLVYGLLYLRYQSLMLCLIAHGLNNLFVAALAPLLVAYLSEAGFLVPAATNLLVLQLVWLLVVIASLGVFLRAVVSHAPADWFKMQPPLPGATAS
jgi:membrane protease YdiL (CAAX protease family)